LADELLVIGWDVGGWMGNNHGFSLIKYRYQQESWCWSGNSVELGIPRDSLFALDYILEKASYKKPLSEHSQVIIAVDAPLTFPAEFKKFLNDNQYFLSRPSKEIYNPLAYRKTDRYIYEKFKKKPLSAVFDRLGTNATVAIAHLRKWRQEYGFSLLPVQKNRPNRIIIEVYPALLKNSKAAPAFKPIKSLLPEDLSPNTNAYDSALCAIMGLAYKKEVNIKGLPELVKVPQDDEQAKKEGWIYHFPPRYFA